MVQKGFRMMPQHVDVPHHTSLRRWFAQGNRQGTPVPSLVVTAIASQPKVTCGTQHRQNASVAQLDSASVFGTEG